MHHKSNMISKIVKDNKVVSKWYIFDKKIKY